MPYMKFNLATVLKKMFSVIALNVVIDFYRPTENLKTNNQTNK